MKKYLMQFLEHLKQSRKERSELYKKQELLLNTPVITRGDSIFRDQVIGEIDLLSKKENFWWWLLP